MCERFLHCPYCSRRLVALCNIAGDNAAGLYLEFFLVKPAGTEESAFAAAAEHEYPSAGRASSGTVDPHDITMADIDQVVGAPVQTLALTRGGFDDDEDPIP